MRFRYDSSVFPSAPMVDVVISHHIGKAASRERALIDTGASVTVIPKRLAKELDLLRRGKEHIAGVFGVESLPKYKMRVTIGDMEFGTIVGVAMNGNWILIGRDIINLWKMTLDGEGETVDIRAWTGDVGALFLRRRRAGP